MAIPHGAGLRSYSAGTYRGGRRGFAASKSLKVLLAICTPNPTCRTTVTKRNLREGTASEKGPDCERGYRRIKIVEEGLVLLLFLFGVWAKRL